jgi:hypothetical protein
VLNHDGFIEQSHGGKLGDGPPVCRQEASSELLGQVLDDVGAFDADSTENPLGFAEVHTVVEDGGKFDDERVSAVALEGTNIFERFSPGREGSVTSSPQLRADPSHLFR